VHMRSRGNTAVHGIHNEEMCGIRTK